jgi:MFS transporter, putative metabolite transport protein
MSESAATDRGGLPALDQRPMSPRQRYAALLVAFGEFIDGYDLLVIGGALIFLKPQFGLSPQETGMLGAAGFLGAMVGLVIFGDLSDRLGRRAIFVANLVFFVVFSIVSAFITSVPQLFVVRFLVGLGVGMDIPTSTAYLAEIAPARHRGKVLGALTQITWILGALTSTLVAIPLQWMFGDAAWRWMFGLAALPAALVLLGRQGLPESPRWLIAHGRTVEARQALASFGIDATDAQLTSTGGRGSWGELFRPPMRRRVWWVTAVFFLSCLSGPVATVATPYVIRTVGAFSVQTTLLFSTLVWGTSLLGSIGSFLLIDRIGRKPLCYLSLIPAGLFALLMGVTAGSSPTMLLVGYFAFSFFLWLGGPSLQWGWSSELFPTRLRGRSQGFCNGMCRLAISINIFLVPVALASIGFGPFVALLSLPLFAYALIVNRIDIFKSEGVSLETLETR